MRVREQEQPSLPLDHVIQDDPKMTDGETEISECQNPFLKRWSLSSGGAPLRNLKYSRDDFTSHLGLN